MVYGLCHLKEHFSQITNHQKRGHINCRRTRSQAFLIIKTCFPQIFSGHRASVTTSWLPVRWSWEPSSPSFDRIPKGRPYKVARWGGDEGVGWSWLVEVGVGWSWGWSWLKLVGWLEAVLLSLFCTVFFWILFYHAIIPYKTIGSMSTRTTEKSKCRRKHKHTCNIHGSYGDYDNMIGCLCLDTKNLWIPCFFPQALPKHYKPPRLKKKRRNVCHKIRYRDDNYIMIQNDM